MQWWPPCSWAVAKRAVQEASASDILAGRAVAGQSLTLMSKGATATGPATAGESAVRLIHRRGNSATELTLRLTVRCEPWTRATLFRVWRFSL